MPSNGLSPDDSTRGEVAYAESTTRAMVVDVIRTGSTQKNALCYNCTSRLGICPSGRGCGLRTFYVCTLSSQEIKGRLLVGAC